MSNPDRSGQPGPFIPDATYPTTRGELLDRGYLVDVSPYAERLGIILPVDVSLQLFADYMNHPRADIGLSQNIMNTLQVLQERILYEDAEDVVRFTMVYPIAGDYASIAVLGILVGTTEGAAEALYLRADPELSQANGEGGFNAVSAADMSG